MAGCQLENTDRSVSPWVLKRSFYPKTQRKTFLNPGIGTAQINYDRKNDILYIRSSNSDGAGGYEVIWRVEKGAYTGRYIAYGF